MKPFNAVYGDTVIVQGYHSKVTARYLAKMEDGRHVVEMVAASDVHFVNVVNEENIFTMPKKRTVWVVLSPGDSTSGYRAFVYNCKQNGVESHPLEIEE